jgi:hypothetical protein|tara:strand:+ start:3685 stop:3957 length:273 start_codon:yes stop_codon:yes gene_type:complete
MTKDKTDDGEGLCADISARNEKPHTYTTTITKVTTEVTQEDFRQIKKQISTLEAEVFMLKGSLDKVQEMCQEVQQTMNLHITSLFSGDHK